MENRRDLGGNGRVNLSTLALLREDIQEILIDTTKESFVWLCLWIDRMDRPKTLVDLRSLSFSNDKDYGAGYC